MNKKNQNCQETYLPHRAILRINTLQPARHSAAAITTIQYRWIDFLTLKGLILSKCDSTTPQSHVGHHRQEHVGSLTLMAPSQRSIFPILFPF